MIKQFLAKGNGLVPLQPFQRVGVNLGPDKLGPERRDISYREGGIYDGQGLLGLGAVNLQGSPGGVQGIGGLGKAYRGLGGPAATYDCKDSASENENLVEHVVSFFKTLIYKMYAKIKIKPCTDSGGDPNPCIVAAKNTNFAVAKTPPAHRIGPLATD